jgi:hypothetical protein
VNSPENIIKRKNFAIDLLECLEKGKVIIKYDESIIGCTTSLSYSWEKRGSVPGRVIKRTVSGVSILLAVSTDGIRFFQFLDGINNQNSVQLFLFELASYLDKYRPYWRETHVFLLDNMSSHKTLQTRRVFEALEIPYMFSAPASFIAMPVESVFKFIKMNDFREKRLPADFTVRGMQHNDLTKK